MAVKGKIYEELKKKRENLGSVLRRCERVSAYHESNPVKLTYVFMIVESLKAVLKYIHVC